MFRRRRMSNWSRVRFGQSKVDSRTTLCNSWTTISCSSLVDHVGSLSQLWMVLNATNGCIAALSSSARSAGSSTPDTATCNATNSPMGIFVYGRNYQGRNLTFFLCRRRKMHVCKICNKTLTRYEHLKRHLITHLKDKPYTCLTCNRGFNRSEHLANHSARCRGEMVHICDICNKGFNREDSLEV